MRKEEINNHTPIGPGPNGYSHEHEETVEPTKFTRPWGHYTILDEGSGYKVKKIVMNPGGAISLQKHRHRAENWSIISGVAKVEIEGVITTLYPNESVYIRVGEIHKCTNIGSIPLNFIEVQTGEYLEEVDIVRLDINSTFGDIL